MDFPQMDQTQPLQPLPPLPPPPPGPPVGTVMRSLADQDARLAALRGWFMAEWPDEDLSVPALPFMRLANAPEEGSSLYDWHGMFMGFVGGYTRATTPEAQKLVLRAVAKDVLIYGLNCDDPLKRMPERFRAAYVDFFTEKRGKPTKSAASNQPSSALSP